MAEKKGSKGGKVPETLPPGMTIPQGGVSLNMGLDTGHGANLPAFLAASAFLAGEADVTDDLGGLAPTFGNVLNSIGVGVAASQEALDKGLVETAKVLSNTKIDLVTQVIQELDEDGLPIAPTDDSNLRKQTVSLVNFISPQAHQWKHVALSMDLSVGEMDNETGMKYNNKQVTARVSNTGLLWGFVGWFEHAQSSREYNLERSTDQEAAWAQGQVRMDALLTPRDTGKFPIPAEVTIGPQIAVGLGGVQETNELGVITRSQNLIITVRKTNGDANPDKTLVITSNSFGIELLANERGDGVFNQTDANGVVNVKIKRRIPSAIFGRPIKSTVLVELGSIQKEVPISL